MDEVAAAYAGDFLSLEDAVRVVCERGRLMQATGGAGAMLAAELSEAEAMTLLNTLTSVTEAVTLGAINGPQSVVFSGEPDAIAILETELQRQQVFCRRLAGADAFHSPQMESILQPLTTALEGLVPQKGQKNTPFWSAQSAENRPLKVTRAPLTGRVGQMLAWQRRKKIVVNA